MRCRALSLCGPLFRAFHQAQAAVHGLPKYDEPAVYGLPHALEQQQKKKALQVLEGLFVNSFENGRFLERRDLQENGNIFSDGFPKFFFRTSQAEL